MAADPYANVFVDGRSHGATPLRRLQLPAGSHELLLQDPETEAIRLRRTITVEPDAVVRVHHRN